MRRLGVVCVGEDCPGINAAIRAVSRQAFARDMEVMGIRRGFKGMLTEEVSLLTNEDVAGILNLGGSFLGVSRLDPTDEREKIDRVREVVARYQMTLLVVMGGHTALKASMCLAEEGVPCLTVPCSIENDIAGTDLSVGFLTAASYVTDALDRLHGNAQAGHRIVVVEVRGAAAGWVATLGGMAGGADFVLTAGTGNDEAASAEAKMQRLYAVLEKRYRAGKAFSIIVVDQRFPLPENLASRLAEWRAGAEGPDQFVAGAGMVVAEHLRQKFKHYMRFVAIGDIQRGGSPHILDRVLATRLGYAAAEAAKHGKTNLLLGVKGLDVITMPYSPALLTPKSIPPDLYQVATAFF